MSNGEMRAKLEQELKFGDWMKKVDQVCELRYGLSVYDLPDCPFWDWFEDGLAATRAAARAIKMGE